MLLMPSHTQAPTEGRKSGMHSIEMTLIPAGMENSESVMRLLISSATGLFISLHFL